MPGPALTVPLALGAYGCLLGVAALCSPRRANLGTLLVLALVLACLVVGRAPGCAAGGEGFLQAPVDPQAPVLLKAPDVVGIANEALLPSMDRVAGLSGNIAHEADDLTPADVQDPALGTKYKRGAQFLCNLRAYDPALCEALVATLQPLAASAPAFGSGTESPGAFGSGTESPGAFGSGTESPGAPAPQAAPQAAPA
jgi:hypothetical protein